MKIIEVNDVTMKFKLYTQKIETLREYLLKFVKGQLRTKHFSALKNVTFSVEKNESVAVIGRNGAGKSTLLKIIAGIMIPTAGTVNINGTVAPLINLGAGFDSGLSAHDNIFLNGAILGYTYKQMKERYDSIVEFSELKDFMNVPIKKFSSGMRARLGFAIATDVDAEIILVDEALGVGDLSFKKKCVERVKKIRASGATFIMVSHSMKSIQDVCPKALWLDKGEVMAYGDTKDVSKEYESFMKTASGTGKTISVGGDKTDIDIADDIDLGAFDEE